VRRPRKRWKDSRAGTGLKTCAWKLLMTMMSQLGSEPITNIILKSRVNELMLMAALQELHVGNGLFL
jgi:hypothetical protein